MGDGFAVDPDALRNAANKHLQNLNDDVKAAKEKVTTAARLGDPFAGQGEIFHGICDFWGDALYYLDRVLGDNVENIDLDRKALCAIANRYDEDEESTANAVRSW